MLPLRHRLIVSLVVTAWLAALPLRAQAQAADDDFRSRLMAQGVELGATYINEVLGVVDGGYHRDAIYAGRLEATLDIDTQTLFGWDGGLLHATGYQLHGRGLSYCCLNNLLPVSNIEARRATRLFTLWAQQSFAGGQASLRVGQIAADDEFFTSRIAVPFINGTFGWPTIMVGATPSGGAAFPIAAPGMRLRVAADANRSILAAVFAGDPAGNYSTVEPEFRNRDGTKFSLSGGVLAMIEGQYNVTPDSDPGRPPAAYKLGLWVQTGDRKLDMFGDTGKRGPSWGAYAIAERRIWRPNGAEGDTGLGFFARISAGASEPQPVRFYVDAGLSYRGPFDRAEDMLGLAFAYNKLSDTLQRADRELGIPARDAEAVIELTYQFAVASWLIVQPDLQYVIRPGGGLLDPNMPTRRIANATVAGLRTTVRF
jgi:porin